LTAAVLDERHQFVVVDAADDDRVDLERAVHPSRCGDTCVDRGKLIEARERGESIAPQCVEADRDPPQAGGLQRIDLILEQHAVGGQGKVREPRLCGQHAHQRGHVAAEQRLAARQADLVHAEREEDVDERARLFEMEDVLPRQPDVVVLRHAVLAAQVAAVGNRQPQIAQRARESIGDHSTRNSSRRDPGMKGREAICPSNAALQRPGTGVRHAPQRPSAVMR
jgi:hypothetical protein